jgi:hypothetical protein
MNTANNKACDLKKMYLNMANYTTLHDKPFAAKEVVCTTQH